MIKQITHCFVFFFFIALDVMAEKDTGKEAVGTIRATLYIGTDEDVSSLGDKLQLVSPEIKKQLASIERTRFMHYRLLGSDTQPVLRTYENWLTPLKPSEEILLSFESRGRSENGGIRLDLEFWQQKRKVMTSDPTLKIGHPLIILGPKWRGGTLIISVELVEERNAE